MGRKLCGTRIAFGTEASSFTRDYHGQDPDVAKIGPEVHKNYAEKQEIPLILGIGADFLMTATPEEIRQRVRRYVNIGKRGGKFLLYLCNIGSKTPRPNLDAAVEATREYGAY